MTLRPGFPIRKSTDQSLLAAPRGLSQRATSFIASQCQGIHQMPLTRLILKPSISQAETKGLGTLSSSVGNLYDHELKERRRRTRHRQSQHQLGSRTSTCGYTERPLMVACIRSTMTNSFSKIAPNRSPVPTLKLIRLEPARAARANDGGPGKI